KTYPVVDGERLVGWVALKSVKALDREDWSRTSVGALAEPVTPDNTIGPEDDAMTAMGRMSRQGLSRLMVVEEGRLVGMIALKDLLRFLAMKVELDPQT